MDHHENESLRGNRFISVIGRRFVDRRFWRHACSALSALYRAHGRCPEYGAVLRAFHRNDTVRYALPDASLGTYWLRRSVDDASFRSGGRSRIDVSRSASGEEGAWVSDQACYATVHSRLMPGSCQEPCLSIRWAKRSPLSRRVRREAEKPKLFRKKRVFYLAVSGLRRAREAQGRPPTVNASAAFERRLI